MGMSCLCNVYAHNMADDHWSLVVLPEGVIMSVFIIHVTGSSSGNGQSLSRWNNLLYATWLREKGLLNKWVDRGCTALLSSIQVTYFSYGSMLCGLCSNLCSFNIGQLLVSTGNVALLLATLSTPCQEINNHSLFQMAGVMYLSCFTPSIFHSCLKSDILTKSGR